MSERYLIISSDCHAGLPCEEYRPYLDARYLGAFDEFLAERHASREEALKLNYDYIMHWESDNEEGLRGAFDPEQRDKELDADGVAAEVIFADADAITGMESPPFGAGLSAGTIQDPELAFAGAIAHNRFLVEFCSRAPERRAGIALVPITHDVERGVAEIECLAGTPGIRGIMIPTMWHDRKAVQRPVVRPGVGRVPRPTVSSCTRTRARRRARSTATTSASTSPRSCGGRPARSRSSSSVASFERHPEPEVRASPRAPRTGPPT